MSSEKATYYLEKLKMRLLLLKLGEVLLISFSISVVLFALLNLLTTEQALIISIVTFFIAAFVIAWTRGIHRISHRQLVTFINTSYPQLEESADLFEKPEDSMTLLEKIQHQRALATFGEIYPSIKIPHKLGRSAIILVASLVVVFAMTSISSTREKTIASETQSTETPYKLPEAKVPASIKKHSIEITPPAYTGIKKYSTENFNLRIPEGSNVKWSTSFDREVKNAFIMFSGRDSVELKQKGQSLEASRQFKASALYHLSWQNETGRSGSDYFRVEVVPDSEPEISFKDLRQSTELKITDKLSMDVHASISDDYKITDAYIIATVAKGSGESVKFREEKLKFTSPVNISGKHFNASRTIDIKKLGLEPGDELYFYAEALDNQQPIPNRSRTETFFISLLDTAGIETSADAGLGVDLMPEYFRSQRQIIIDTEKLLAQKKKIAKKDFNFTSNELGYDQKVLRLKYGEFLGEEFESELASTEDVMEDEIAEIRPEGEEKSVEEKFGHAHDKDNEHNLVDDKKTSSKGHQHAETKNPEEKEDPLKGFIHDHDDSEEATFFLQSVRTKLKAALTEMWDAELYLRLYQPEKSLPYQYKALKLLKEVSNDSRIYVHKTGFDPPPIKEEKRLSGDLNEIKNSRLENDQTESIVYPNVREAIVMLQRKITQEQPEFSDFEKVTLQKAGQELSVLALEWPGEFLTALSIIKNIHDNEVKPEAFKSTLIILQKKFWKALPSHKTASPEITRSGHTLDQSFIKNLELLKNE